jgi:hypothetical protein
MKKTPKSQTPKSQAVTVKIIKGEKKSKWVDLYFNGVQVSWLTSWCDTRFNIKAYQKCAEKIVGMDNKDVWTLPEYNEYQKRYDMFRNPDTEIVKNFVDLDLVPLVYEGNTYRLAMYYKRMYMGEISYLENYPMYAYYRVVHDFFGDFFNEVPENANQEILNSLKRDDMNEKYDSLRGNKEEIAKILEKYL